MEEEKQTTETSEDDLRAKRPNISRRSMCLGIGGAAALVALGGLKYVGSTPVVRPPGGQDEDRLVSACVRCQKCYEACPRGVIAPVHVEDGILQTRTPKMYFDNGWCDFCADENGGVPLCVEVCPTRALELPAGATAQSTIIGKAAIDTDTCLAYRLTGCRFCYDACPYEAIELDEINRPVVIADKCNGCGACESVCVSLKEGSISSGATKRAIIVEPQA